MYCRVAVGSMVILCACEIMIGGRHACGQTPEPLPTAEQIAAEIQEVEAASDLNDAKKASIKQLYQQAAAALEGTSKATENVARFDEMTQDAATNLKAATEKLSSLPKQPQAISDALKLTELQQRLAEVEADVLRHRDDLVRLNGEVAARQVRQREVPMELDAARQQLAEISKQTATADPDNEQPLLTRARKTYLRTQAAFLAAKISALEKELPAYAATAELLPKQRDLAGQQLSLAESTRQALMERIDQLRRSEVSSQVDQATFEAERAPETLKPIATTTLDYATQNQAILRKLKETTDARSEADRLLENVKQESKRTREKVDTVGLTDALGILLRTKRNDLTIMRGQHHPDRARRSAVSELQLELLQLEDARVDLTQIEEATTKTLDNLQLDSTDPRLRNVARKLLDSQRQALDSLLQNQRDYFESLVALDSAERELVQQIDEFATYIEGLILWVRSVPRLSLSDIGNAGEAVQWLASPSEWNDLGATAVGSLSRRPLWTGTFGLVFLALVWRQRRLRNRLREVGDRAKPRRCREFSLTAEATVITILIAAVWPTLLFFLGWLLVSDSSSTSTKNQALGWALVSSGAFLLMTESVRQVLRSQGLAESHFGWPERVRRQFTRHLRWFSLTTPLVFLVVFLRTQPNEIFHLSLGRLCFLALMLCAAFLAIRTLRPGGELYRHLGEHEPANLSYRLRTFVFVLAVGMPCLLFILACAGYYYSAYQLAQRFLESVALAFASLTVMGLLLRSILIHRRRLTFEQKMASRRRAAQSEVSDSQPDFLTEAETAVDLVQVTRQTHEFVRVLLIVVAFIFGWWIWNDVLPAFEFLASIKVWQLNLPTKIEIITLKHLFLSMLSFALTFVAVKNVPGLLELLFLQRLPLDAGARYAVTTIVRYLLALIGIIIAFGFIRVQWSQYGWLVAAATVGLGFGLQEIFANFVSGLIVLLERPIRVGDVVTVDGITGVVQRIHMRATVLRNWDHQELIVPNREFVTTKLLNWTLSNSINRVVINVGIAYDADASRARDLMVQVVNEHSNVLEDPGPSVTFEEFGDSTLNFVIRCYIPQLDGRLGTIHELHAELHRRLNAAGIEIAFPQRDLHLRSVPSQWQPPTEPRRPAARRSDDEN